MKTTLKILNKYRWLLGLLSGLFFTAKAEAATITLGSQWVNDALLEAPKHLEGGTAKVVSTLGSDSNSLVTIASAPTFSGPTAYIILASSVICVLYYRRCKTHFNNEQREKKLEETLDQYIRTNSDVPADPPLSNVRPVPSLPKRRWDRITQNVTLD